MLSTGHSVSRLLAQRCPSCWIRHEFLGEALGNRKGLAASTSVNPSSDLNGLWVMSSFQIETGAKAPRTNRCELALLTQIEFGSLWLALGATSWVKSA